MRALRRLLSERLGIELGGPQLLIVIVALIYLASVVWAFRDARRRGRSGLHGALPAALLPGVGLVIWCVIRPDAADRWRRK